MNYKEFNEAKIKCRECPLGEIYNRVVCSDGCKKNPQVMIIGEAPGKDEVAEGKPFVGRAGQVLRNVIKQLGYNRKNTIISNIMPCRPLNNKFPTDENMVIDCMSRWFDKEINIVKPRVMVLLGSQPLKYILEMSGITKCRGKWYRTKYGIYALPTFHPSYVMRKRYAKDGSTVEEDFCNDLEKVAEKLGINK